MKLTVLTDNNTIIDRYLLGEPALSFYLEDGAGRLLFDTGYSDVFMQNAAQLHFDLSQVPLLVFSHGHNDHTRGLLALHRQDLLRGKTIVAHPAAFAPKYLEQQGQSEDIGSPYTADFGPTLHTAIIGSTAATDRTAIVFGANSPADGF